MSEKPSWARGFDVTPTPRPWELPIPDGGASAPHRRVCRLVDCVPSGIFQAPLFINSRRKSSACLRSSMPFLLLSILSNMVSIFFIKSAFDIIWPELV